MKYNDSIELLKLFAKAIFEPRSITTDFRKRESLKYSRGLESNNSINNSRDKSIYAEPENSNIEYNQSSNKEFNESIPSEDSGFYNDNKSNGYYNKQQDTSSNPQGVIDSITQEITSVKLKQAIILSEIVGKPRSKTRKKRRF
jgi:hypothetical protein